MVLHLRAQGLGEGDEHPPTLSVEYGELYLLPMSPPSPSSALEVAAVKPELCDFLVLAYPDCLEILVRYAGR